MTVRDSVDSGRDSGRDSDSARGDGCWRRTVVSNALTVSRLCLGRLALAGVGCWIGSVVANTAGVCRIGHRLLVLVGSCAFVAVIAGAVTVGLVAVGVDPMLLEWSLS